MRGKNSAAFSWRARAKLRAPVTALSLVVQLAGASTSSSARRFLQ
jgi:hypothetical protein